MLAWLGVDQGFQGRGLGRLLLAQALRDCYDAGQTFSFIAVILDCVDDAARRSTSGTISRSYQGTLTGCSLVRSRSSP